MNMKNFLPLLAALMILGGTICAKAQNAPQLSEDNVEEVLKAMTLEEKARLLIGATGQEPTGGTMVGMTRVSVPGAAGVLADIPRLGIPRVIVADGPAGLRISPTRSGDNATYYCTGYPIGSCLAATWNPAVVELVGNAVGHELREYGVDVILGPGVNIHRNPLCGRNFEYYSEDPLVTGKIAAGYIRGVQSQSVGTSIKHFAVNSQEGDRLEIDERVSQRALREIYLRGFEIAIREGDPWTLMSAYNKINGTHAHENRDLLTDVLRTDWGYKGVVMTDWVGHRNTAAEVHAGNDLMMPGYMSQVNDIIDKVKSGQLAESDVDTCARRILRLIAKTPKAHGVTFSNKPDQEYCAQICRQAGAEGIVLLKNEAAANGNVSDNAGHVLPMKNVKTIALFGVSSYDFAAGGYGSGFVNTPYVVNMVEGLKNAGISTTETLTDIYQKYVEYAKAKFYVDRDPLMWFYDPGLGLPKLDEIELSRRCIKAEAEKADAAIITIGRQAGENIDRDADTEFYLNEVERDMIMNVSSAFRMANKPVIVVINSGSVIETASWRDLADAIVLAWQPGQEGGNSVTDILTGKVCPSGKTPMTWPTDVSDHPSTANFPQSMTLYDFKQTRRNGGDISTVDYTNHEEDIYVGYRYFSTFGKKTAYPFGFGLSYTTFEYGKPSIKVADNMVTISVDIKNTGRYAGKEVVQVYVTAPGAAGTPVANQSSIQKPRMELKSFAKTQTLQPGESETLTMTIPVRDIASFDEANSQWIVEAGKYTFNVAASAEDIKSSVTVSLREYTEKTTNALAPKTKINVLRY